MEVIVLKSIPELQDYQLSSDLQNILLNDSRHYLVTGGAGFIGSNIVEMLLRLNQRVTSLDNFSTGHEKNLIQVKNLVGPDNWKNHNLIKGDISDIATCVKACKGVDVVLHQAALGSVPRSIADPIATHSSNATGFLNMLIAARDEGIDRFVYAASSSTYGDSKALPKEEGTIGNPLSPYAVTKYVNELYANVFASCFGMETVGLRYFNVFGPRQDPNGAYAAVIPKWISYMLSGKQCTINGDGQTSRDFCFIANAVQANIRAATTTDSKALNQVYNVAFGKRTSLIELHSILKQNLCEIIENLHIEEPLFADFRKGDVLHSLADIEKAKTYLGYSDLYAPETGLKYTSQWFAQSSIGNSNQ